MNSSDDQRVSIDPRLLDLLVNGELPDPERQTLLGQLDRVPGGWRRCALAFLESQCWSDEFRTAVQQRQVEPVSRGISPRTSRWGDAGERS